MGPELLQHPLSRADGSAVFCRGACAVVAAVNGPVEVQRRDELPEEATVEVNVRPRSGVGGPRERWLENTLSSALQEVLLTNMHPRSLIQITLQLTKEPGPTLRRATADISIIPTLLNAAFAALVDSGLPLSSILVSTLATVQNNGEILMDPQERDIVEGSSIHAMAYNGRGEQILSESLGEFNMELWERVAEASREACMRATAPVGVDTTMQNDGLRVEPWLREALKDHAEAATGWRANIT